jgi:hypothetical protein
MKITSYIWFIGAIRKGKIYFLNFEYTREDFVVEVLPRTTSIYFSGDKAIEELNILLRDSSLMDKIYKSQVTGEAFSLTDFNVLRSKIETGEVN